MKFQTVKNTLSFCESLFRCSNCYKEENSINFGARIVIPIIVFNDAVNKNMFHHSGISKRNKYIFKNQDEFAKWQLLNGMLDRVELQVFPLRLSYVSLFTFAYFRRWREILVYAKAYFLLKKGYKIYDVEEKILSDH